MLSSLSNLGYYNLEEIKYNSYRVCQVEDREKQQLILKWLPNITEDRLEEIQKMQQDVENQNRFVHIRNVIFDGELLGIEMLKYNQLQFPLIQNTLKNIIESLANIFDILVKKNWSYFNPKLENILIDNNSIIKILYFSNSNLIYKEELKINDQPNELAQRYSVYLGLLWYNLKNGKCQHYKSIQSLLDEVNNSEVEDKQKILNLITLKESFKKYLKNPIIIIKPSLQQKNNQQFKKIKPYNPNQQNQQEVLERKNASTEVLERKNASTEFYQQEVLERKHASTEFQINTWLYYNQEQQQVFQTQLTIKQQLKQQNKLQENLQQYFCDQELANEIMEVCIDNGLSKESKQEQILSLCMSKIAL